MSQKRVRMHHLEKQPFVVVSVNPDGTVDTVFNTAKDAAKFHQVNDETIRRYCRTGKIGFGKKWFYEEDFRKIYMSCELEKLQFTLPDDYEPKRSYFYKGHTKGNGWNKLSEKVKNEYRERGRVLIRRIHDLGLLDESRRKRGKPIVCLNDGKEFPSITHAAKHYGIPRSSIQACFHRVGITHNLKFRLKSQLANIKEVI